MPEMVPEGRDFRITLSPYGNLSDMMFARTEYDGASFAVLVRKQATACETRALARPLLEYEIRDREYSLDYEEDWDDFLEDD